MTPKNMASILIEEKVLQLGEKFILTMSIHLEVPKESEHITRGIMMKVTLHEESLNAGLRISMLSIMTDLLRCYNPCPE